MNSSLHQKRRNTNPHHTCPYYMRCNYSFWSRCRASNVVIYLLSISHGNSPSSKKQKTKQHKKYECIKSVACITCLEPSTRSPHLLQRFFVSRKLSHNAYGFCSIFYFVLLCIFCFHLFCFHSINTERQQTASPTKNNVCTSETSNPVQNKNTKKKQRCI